MKSGNTGLGARKAISGCEIILPSSLSIFFSLLVGTMSFLFPSCFKVPRSVWHYRDFFYICFFRAIFHHVSLIPPNRSPHSSYLSVPFSPFTTALFHAISSNISLFSSYCLSCHITFRASPSTSPLLDSPSFDFLFDIWYVYPIAPKASFSHSGISFDLIIYMLLSLFQLAGHFFSVFENCDREIKGVA